MGCKNILLNNPDNNKSFHALQMQTSEIEKSELQSPLHQKPCEKSLQDNKKETFATSEGNSAEIVV